MVDTILSNFTTVCVHVSQLCIQSVKVINERSSYLLNLKKIPSYSKHN